MQEMALSRGQIVEAALREKKLHERIHSTYARRGEGKKQYEDWSAATDEWRSHSSLLDFFWTDEFIEQLKNGDRSAVESSILFLEVDPFYYRSGYLKEKLTRHLKGANLTERDKIRLRSVVWNMARGPNRREFTYYCSLASRISTHEFEAQIQAGLEQNDDASKWKMSKLLSRIMGNRPEA